MKPEEILNLFFFIVVLGFVILVVYLIISGIIEDRKRKI
jgi:hypothetical protein